MKHAIILTAVTVALCSCDGEKAQEAKKQISEAAKATGEAAKEMGNKAKDASKDAGGKMHELGSKAIEAGKDLEHKIAEKGKAVIDKAAPAVKEMIAKGKDAVHNAAPKVRAAVEQARAASASALAGLNEKSRPAVEALKGKLKNLSNWYRDTEHQQSKDPAAAKQIFDQLHNELKTVETADLPAEVKDALTKYRSVMEQQNTLMQTMPATEADINTWMIQNYEKLSLINNAVKPAAAALQEAAAKYGIEGLSFIDDAAAEAEAPAPTPAPSAPPAPPAGQ